jgi:CheY-like chemotaxis protein
MTRKPMVLIVDDDLDSAEVMRMSVAAFCGAETWVANDAKSAIDLARELRPDAIVLDVGLPGTDGITFARWIRADGRFSATTLIAVTGHVGARAACLDAGCDHFMLKPADVSELRGLIERGRAGVDGAG